MEQISYCSACGSVVPTAARFCQHCGANLVQQTSPAAIAASPEEIAAKLTPVAGSVPPPKPLYDLDQASPPPANPPLSAGGRIQVWEMKSQSQQSPSATIPPPPPPPTAISAGNWPCPSCGQTMPTSARFCRHCGAEKMVSPEIQPTPESAPPPSVPSLELVCPHCNRPEPANANFCRSCGRALIASPQPTGTGVCPQCRQPFVPGANFCRACGFKVGELLTGAKTLVMPPPPPGAAPVSQMSPGTGAAVFAGFWWRTLAMILDSVPLGLVIGAFSLLLFGAFPADPYQMTRAPGKTAVYYIFTILIVWLYFALLESSPWQATPGKRALGLYVTDLQGRRLTFGRATARNFGKYISGLILGIGYFMAGFTKQKQALHDLMAQCLVWKKGQ